MGRGNGDDPVSEVARRSSRPQSDKEIEDLRQNITPLPQARARKLLSEQRSAREYISDMPLPAWVGEQNDIWRDTFKDIDSQVLPDILPDIYRNYPEDKYLLDLFYSVKKSGADQGEEAAVLLGAFDRLPDPIKASLADDIITVIGSEGAETMIGGTEGDLVGIGVGLVIGEVLRRRRRKKEKEEKEKEEKEKKDKEEKARAESDGSDMVDWDWPDR